MNGLKLMQGMRRTSTAYETTSRIAHSTGTTGSTRLTTDEPNRWEDKMGTRTENLNGLRRRGRMSLGAFVRGLSLTAESTGPGSATRKTGRPRIHSDVGIKHAVTWLALIGVAATLAVGLVGVQSASAASAPVPPAGSTLCSDNRRAYISSVYNNYNLLYIPNGRTVTAAQRSVETGGRYNLTTSLLQWGSTSDNQALHWFYRERRTELGLTGSNFYSGGPLFGVTQVFRNLPPAYYRVEYYVQFSSYWDYGLDSNGNWVLRYWAAHSQTVAASGYLKIYLNEGYRWGTDPFGVPIKQYYPIETDALSTTYCDLN